MKKIYILLGLLYSMNTSSQTCSAEFDIIPQTSYTFLFVPKINNKSDYIQHFWEFGDVNKNSMLIYPTYTFEKGTYDIVHYLLCYDTLNSKLNIDTVIKTIIVPFNQSSNIRVYPNPISNTSNIILNLDQSNIVHTYIYNNQQHLVFQSHQSGNTGLNQIPINLSNKPMGIYYIVVIHDKNIYKSKVMKL